MADDLTDDLREQLRRHLLDVHMFVTGAGNWPDGAARSLALAGELMDAAGPHGALPDPEPGMWFVQPGGRRLSVVGADPPIRKYRAWWMVTTPGGGYADWREAGILEVHAVDGRLLWKNPAPPVDEEEESDGE